MDFDLEKAFAVLERTPKAIRELLADLPNEWLDATEGPNTWSPYAIVGHLLCAERANWLVRAKQMLDQGEQRRFVPFEREAPPRSPDSPTIAHLLDEFARERASNLATVRGWNLTDEQLALEGEHPQFGAVSLRQLLATWTVHDLGHIAQIARVMAKQYREAVGPWQTFLPIVNR
jgi:hypothetical protein